MTDLRTSRLQLHAIDVAEAERIVARSAGPADAWADDFPFEGDVGAVGRFLHSTAEHGEQRPFGYYRITRLADGLAIGGLGFKGRPGRRPRRDRLRPGSVGPWPWLRRGSGRRAAERGRRQRTVQRHRRDDSRQHRVATDPHPSPDSASSAATRSSIATRCSSRSRRVLRRSWVERGECGGLLADVAVRLVLSVLLIASVRAAAAALGEVAPDRRRRGRGRGEVRRPRGEDGAARKARLPRDRAQLGLVAAARDAVRRELAGCGRRSTPHAPPASARSSPSTPSRRRPRRPRRARSSPPTPRRSSARSLPCTTLSSATSRT